jgi:hypothetical protein
MIFLLWLDLQKCICVCRSWDVSAVHKQVLLYTSTMLYLKMEAIYKRGQLFNNKF